MSKVPYDKQQCVRGSRLCNTICLRYVCLQKRVWEGFLRTGRHFQGEGALDIVSRVYGTAVWLTRGRRVVVSQNAASRFTAAGEHLGRMQRGCLKMLGMPRRWEPDVISKAYESG